MGVLWLNKRIGSDSQIHWKLMKLYLAELDQVILLTNLSNLNLQAYNASSSS